VVPFTHTTGAGVAHVPEHTSPLGPTLSALTMPGSTGPVSHAVTPVDAHTARIFLLLSAKYTSVPLAGVPQPGLDVAGVE
jgi:hypothetical protein